MKKFHLKILKYFQLKLFWFFLLVIFIVLSACGDLVKESDKGACDSAIDARSYDTALSVCTTRKDKASAYMGKAGYDIINLLKSSGTTTSAFTAPSGVSLGTDDVTGASILNILQLGVDVIADDTTRATAITSSKNNLDSASALLHPYLSDNSSPLTTDEIFLNTFALSFAMQLNQIILYDNATTSTSKTPSGTPLSCAAVSGADGADASAMLKAMDGHLWESERDGMQCIRVKAALEGLDDSSSAISALASWSPDNLLPDAIRDAVCDPLDSMTIYLTKITDSVSKLTLSGDNTASITNAQTSSNALMKNIGCKE